MTHDACIRPAFESISPTHLRMTTLTPKTSRAMPLRRVALAFASSALIAGCASGGAWNSDDQKAALSVGAVGHYGKGIGIPMYSLGNFHGGNSTGWGGGGSTVCCVLVPRDMTKPVMVKVTWKTYRSGVDEERQHEATVPIRFTVPPGQGGGLIAHFLPGHKVELWYSDWGPGSTNYAGPRYPDDPGPEYVPLPGEKPQPLVREILKN